MAVGNAKLQGKWCHQADFAWGVAVKWQADGVVSL